MAGFGLSPSDFLGGTKRFDSGSDSVLASAGIGAIPGGYQAPQNGVGGFSGGIHDWLVTLDKVGDSVFRGVKAFSDLEAERTPGQAPTLVNLPSTAGGIDTNLLLLIAAGVIVVAFVL